MAKSSPAFVATPAAPVIDAPRAGVINQTPHKGAYAKKAALVAAFPQFLGRASLSKGRDKGVTRAANEVDTLTGYALAKAHSGAAVNSPDMVDASSVIKLKSDGTPAAAAMPDALAFAYLSAIVDRHAAAFDAVQWAALADTYKAEFTRIRITDPAAAKQAAKDAKPTASPTASEGSEAPDSEGTADNAPAVSTITQLIEVSGFTSEELTAIINACTKAMPALL